MLYIYISIVWVSFRTEIIQQYTYRTRKKKIIAQWLCVREPWKTQWLCISESRKATTDYNGSVMKHD